MLTPKQLKVILTVIQEEQKRLIAIDPALEQHFSIQSNIESLYFKNALAGIPILITPTLKVTINDTIEVLDAKEPKYHTKRLIAIAAFRTALRLVKLNLPIAAKTKEWLQVSVCADDFRVEAEKISAP